MIAERPTNRYLMADFSSSDLFSLVGLHELVVIPPEGRIPVAFPILGLAVVNDLFLRSPRDFFGRTRWIFLLFFRLCFVLISGLFIDDWLVILWRPTRCDLLVFLSLSHLLSFRLLLLLRFWVGNESRSRRGSISFGYQRLQICLKLLR